MQKKEKAVLITPSFSSINDELTTLLSTELARVAAAAENTQECSPKRIRMLESLTNTSIKLSNESRQLDQESIVCQLTDSERLEIAVSVIGSLSAEDKLNIRLMFEKDRDVQQLIKSRKALP